MIGSKYFKIPLRSNAILNIENNDKHCFICSMLATLHPCNKKQPNIVSNYKQYFNELNIQGLDFTNGLNCNDVHHPNELNNLSIYIFELNFYQDQNKWNYKLISIEVSENESDRVVDLLLYKNHYALTKKLNVFLGDHHKTFICRRCLNSYKSEEMLMLHKQECRDDSITTIKTSNELHLHRKKHFNKNPLRFWIYAVFEADNEKDYSSIGYKTTTIYKQNPVLNGYHIISELEDVLKSGYYKASLGNNNEDWFVNEVITLEKKWFSILKALRKILL